MDGYAPTKSKNNVLGLVVYFVKDFYNRNLFERLIIYVFLSHFLVKIIFELGMGQWSFTQSQNQQWVFYILLGLDYLVSYKKVLNLSVTVNPMSLFAFVFFIMCVHGLFMGLTLHNPPFVIFNDFVPLFMIGLNILRMQSASEYKEIDFQYLVKICVCLAVGTSILGQIGAMAGLPTQPSVGSTAFYPLVLAGIFTMKPFPKWLFVVLLALVALNISDINRTTMAFIAIVSGGYIGLESLKNPVKGIMAVGTVVLLITLGWVAIPTESKTYNRIENLTKIDLSERKGAIGERQAEWDAIIAKLKSKGETVELLGLGFGGLYEVRFTHQWVKDYGHAHYSWSWFNLRFGQTGYIYMLLLFVALGYNAYRTIITKTSVGLFVSFLCVLGIVYCFTHVNSVWLLMGVQFLSTLPLSSSSSNYSNKEVHYE